MSFKNNIDKSHSKSRNYCCVPQCSTYYGGDVSFHKFPLHDEKLTKEWIRILKIGKKVTKYMVVCSKHFKNEDYFLNKAFVNKNPRLKRNVVPSQNIPQLSHQKKTDEKTILARSSRCARRQQLREEILSENRRNLESTNQEPPVEMMMYEDDAIEIAEVLLSLQDVKMETNHDQAVKTFEDKCVQVDTEEIKTLQKFDVSDIMTTNYKLKVLTGVSNVGLLHAVVAAVLVLFGNNKKTKLCMKKMVLLTLMRIKLDLTFSALGVLFNISSVTAKTYFENTIKKLSVVLKPVIRLPPREEILSNLPKCFENFKQTLIVLDCTEIEIQKSKCLTCRLKSYSFYKGRQTVKFLIGTTPSGLISYLSKPYGGRASDKAIFNKEKLIERLEPPGACMVDKGFLIDKECAENNIQLFRPPFLRKKKQLSKAEAIYNAQIARARVHIERRIQRLKNFRVCRNTIPWSLIPFIHSIMIVVVALTNLSAPILTPDKFST